MKKRQGQLSARAVMTAVAAAAFIPFVVVELFRSGLYGVMDTASYLVFHNVTEFFSVMVALSIFGVGWFTFDQSRDRHALFLSTAFLAIGIMDFMHTLGYAGMPAFITPNSANKSTQFWIAVRFFAAASFLGSAYVFPGSKGMWLSKAALLAGALAVSGIVFTLVTFFPAYIPATYIEGAGLTSFKKASEYVIILLLILASAAYWRRMEKTGNGLLLYYLSAFVLCIFSELVFAVYRSVFDTFNVLGHLYKVAAFSLIYKGIFAASVRTPYAKLTESEEKLHRDIADRESAEHALEASEKKLRAILEATSEGILVADVERRRFAMGTVLSAICSAAAGKSLLPSV